MDNPDLGSRSRGGYGEIVYGYSMAKSSYNNSCPVMSMRQKLGKMIDLGFVLVVALG